jgi:ABC-type amino acid transport substrate-binding protein
MKNRHHHPRRSFLRDGKQHKKLRLNFTLRGEKGKPVRIALCCAAGLVLLVLLAALLKPRTQLMNTPEIQRIRERGVLAVGVRDDMPLFAEGGEGFEIELAQKFAAYLLPDTAGDAAAKLITVNGKTASTKLSDGTIDAAVALMPRGASSKYVYSYPYYTDTCSVLVKSGSETTPLNELVIGFVQGTAGETRLKKYIDAHETKVERTLIDRLKGRTPELPADAIVFTTKAFASYPELFDALARGTVAGTAQDMRKIYLHTDLSAMKQVSAMSNMQSPQLRMNPPLLSLRNCSSMTCKKAVSLMHCLKNTDFDSSL